jgi:hypothetical protein
MKSPGGDASATVLLLCSVSIIPLVVIFDCDDNQCVRRFAFSNFEDQPELVIESDRPLVLSISFQLFEVQSFPRVQVFFIGGTSQVLDSPFRVAPRRFFRIVSMTLVRGVFYETSILFG